jgi:hypothetical protein
MTRNAEEERRWNVFISYASEDKDGFVRPLATALAQLGVSVWFDEFEIEVGDSISRSIDRGLARSSYGIVVLSSAFFEKAWTEHELRGLISREIVGGKVILPIWHGVTREQVIDFSPSLADKRAFRTSDMSASDIAISLLKVIRPEIYEEHPRAELEKIVNGEALRELQAEMERMQDDLERVEQCPVCKAPLVSMGQQDLPEYHTIVTNKRYACGATDSEGGQDQPCPAAPYFPKFEDYEVRTKYDEDHNEWSASAWPKTEMAKRVWLPTMPGRIEEEAIERLTKYYESIAKH